MCDAALPKSMRGGALPAAAAVSRVTAEVSLSLLTRTRWHRFRACLTQRHGIFVVLRRGLYYGLVRLLACRLSSSWKKMQKCGVGLRLAVLSIIFRPEAGHQHGHGC